MKKRMICALLCASLCLTPALAAGIEEKFPAGEVYPGYSDVAEKDWFYDNARLCYEIGLMKGTNLGFEPHKVLTVGEVAAVAARIREKITGEAIVMGTPAPGEKLPWYKWYIDYLAACGVTVSEPEKAATRMEFVALLGAVLPEEYLAPINDITSLPDTGDQEVLRFYNAGILTGTDKYGTFAGDKTLSRAECAAMVSRVAREGLRKEFTPEVQAPAPDMTQALTAAYMTADTVVFTNGLNATEFLITVNNAIAAWETALGEEFNWHYVWTDGKTVLNHVKEDTLTALGVTADMGTEAYQDFDVQVYYARYISLTGETLSA